MPYFQVTVDGNGNPIGGTALARDTIVTIANASAAPMIAHVNVYDRYSSLQLDFNVALTGFDVQAWRMSDILSGNLPVTVNAAGDDACQSNPNSNVYPDPDGFLRVKPLSPATPLDNTAGITKYGTPAFSFPLGLTLATECDGTVDPLAIGYIEIDHANYCNLSDPTDPNYYFHNAPGMENNLFGEIIFTSGNGLPTFGISTVNIEADFTIGQASLNAVTNGDLARTHYARYWEGIAGPPYPPPCPNCGSGVATTDLSISAPWDVTLLGDQREPLGLRYALRWFDLTSTGVLTTNFMVWRGSPTAQSFTDFCTDGEKEPPVAVTFFDEDENTVHAGGCPSPCTSPQFSFELETNYKNITNFQHPTSGSAGWVEVNFVNATAGSVLDQAWGAYTFEGSIALESVLIPGTQLDPNSCDPLGISGVEPIVPVVPTIPTGCGPSGGC